MLQVPAAVVLVLVVAVNAVFPNLVARVMRIVDGFLPQQVGQSGDQARPGAEVRHEK